MLTLPYASIQYRKDVTMINNRVKVLLFWWYHIHSELPQTFSVLHKVSIHYPLVSKLGLYLILFFIENRKAQRTDQVREDQSR